MKKKSTLLLLLCWLAYVGAYLGRYSYNSNISQIILHYGISHAEGGMAATVFFFTYGGAMVAAGILCKRFNKRLAIPMALLVSGAVNLAVFLDPPFRTIKYLWGINGLAQSLLWPTLVEVLSENMQGERLERSVVAMSTTVVAGTILAYGLSAVLARTGAFRLSFLVGAVGMAVIAVIWLSCYDAFTAGNERYESVGAPKANTGKGIRAVLPIVSVLCVFAVINNLLRDGLTSWLPSILQEKYGVSGSNSILLTISLPIIGFAGTFFAVRLSRRIKSYIKLTGVLFAMAFVCMALVVGTMRLAVWLPVVIAFAFACFLMHGTNNVITSLVPLYLRDKADSGMLAGVLNGFCTLGSMLSAYALGDVADKHGWNAVFVLLLVLSAVPAVSAFIIRNNKRLTGES